LQDDSKAQAGFDGWTPTSDFSFTFSEDDNNVSFGAAQSNIQSEERGQNSEVDIIKNNSAVQV